MLRETLRQFDVEAVAGAGDEIGVLDAQVAQFAACLDFREIGGAGKWWQHQHQHDDKQAESGNDLHDGFFQAG
jgi:hypothetical protein